VFCDFAIWWTGALLACSRWSVRQFKNPFGWSQRASSKYYTEWEQGWVRGALHSGWCCRLINVDVSYKHNSDLEISSTLVFRKLFCKNERVGTVHAKLTFVPRSEEQKNLCWQAVLFSSHSLSQWTTPSQTFFFGMLIFVPLPFGQ